MTKFDLEDDFGRHTRFEGDLLIEETTDNGHKPQWTDIDVYRTTGGKYVVRSEVQYRVRHALMACRRVAEAVPATEQDTFPCPVCGPGPWAQASRVKIEVYDGPHELIASFSSINQQTGLPHHSQFSQAILAEISEKDAAVAEAWMTRVIA